MKKHTLFITMIVALAMILASCSNNIPNSPNGSNNPNNPGNGNDRVWETKNHYYGKIKDPEKTGNEVLVSKTTKSGDGEKEASTYYLMQGLNGSQPRLYGWTDDDKTSNVFNYDEENYDADYVIYMEPSAISYETIDDDKTLTHNKYVIVNWNLSKVIERFVNEDKTITYKELPYDKAKDDQFYKFFKGKAVVRGKDGSETDKNYVHFMMSEADSFTFDSSNQGLSGLGVMRSYDDAYDLIQITMAEWGN